MSDGIDGLRERAEAGDPEALFELGIRHLEGDGVPMSEEDAMGCFREAAMAGSAKAAFNLGVAAGRADDPNWREVCYWISMAADRGLPRAMLMMGALYEDGLGVERSYEAAASWYARAADLGERDAMLALADLYEDGLGVPRSSERAEEIRRIARSG